MKLIKAESKPCGVDWQALRVARTQAFYKRVLRACQERFRQNKEAKGNGKK